MVYREITNKLIELGLTVTTMESCTGGLIASLLTDTEGSSSTINGAFVTYSNKAKVLQGVPAKIISEYGVYSEETAIAMAKACRSAYSANIGIGVTGTSGNTDPSNPGSTPGEVFYAIDFDGRVFSYHLMVEDADDRSAFKKYVAENIGDRLLHLLSDYDLNFIRELT